MPVNTPYKHSPEKIMQRSKAVVTAVSLSLLFFTSQALAQTGGLDKVNSFMDNVLGVLRGMSIAVVTIAIIWAGYKFLFKHADIGECVKILGGGLLIGSASEIARYMLG